ncbi:MAG TPA: hypothetical protein VED01_00460 [Burkholderiales bacterium]|nr:hypothetical protein [Burkholderiales bacterium]
MQKTNACIITPRAAGRGQYHWTWRAADGQQASRCHFRYFYDCVTDARASGFDVDVPAVVEYLKSGDRAADSASAAAGSELRAA